MPLPSINVNTRDKNETLPRASWKCLRFCRISPTHSRFCKLARKTDDLWIIKMCLGVDNGCGSIKSLLDAKTPSPDLGFGQRSPDHGLVRVRINTQRLTNIEILVKAVVHVKCSFSKRQPLLADAELNVGEVGGIVGPGERMGGMARAPGNGGIKPAWVVDEGGRSAHVFEVACGVLHVADAAGEAKAACFLLIAQRHIPDVLIEGGREEKAIADGCVVTHEVAAQGIHIVGDLTPGQVADDGGFRQIQTDAEGIVVMDRGIIHLASEVD